jgi:ABC-type sugar transport system substrate-binding protein
MGLVSRQERVFNRSLSSTVSMAWCSMLARSQRGWAAWLLLVLALAPQWGWAQSVVFINPGRGNEAYWRTASEAMAAAAASLRMSLEVRYAERNPLQAISIARELAARPKAGRPRFVVFVNESSVAPEILRTLEAAQIDSFMAFNGVQASAHAQLGRPRETFKHWLGSLEPQAEEAGYLTAKALIEVARASRMAQASDGKLQMLAIAGDRSTSSSIERNAGMRRAVAEAGDVELQQEVFGEWRRERAAEQMRVLMQRYPQARTVWAGNDEMALGAMEAWRAAGGRPGRDGFFSAINTSAAALTAIRTGELAALAGGHFMAGAWAMVMLYDYAHDRDFEPEGLELQRSMFVMFDPLLADRFEQRFSAARKPLDFRKHSKALNPKLGRYSFEIEKLLR